MWIKTFGGGRYVTDPSAEAAQLRLQIAERLPIIKELNDSGYEKVEILEQFRRAQEIDKYELSQLEA